MRCVRVELNRCWEIGAQLGAGGFGRVFVATGDDGTAAVAKFVPKVPGAERELLFIRLDNVRNVIPVIDYGATSDDWVLVILRADRSLRDELADSSGHLALGSALAALPQCRGRAGGHGWPGRPSRPEGRERPVVARNVVSRGHRHLALCRSIHGAGYTEVRDVAAVCGSGAVACRARHCRGRLRAGCNRR